MQRTTLPIAILRILLVALFSFTLLMQVMSLPGQFAPAAGDGPEQQVLGVTLLVVAELAVLCVQVVIVCTWRLLSMVQRDRIFSEASLAWVDVVVWTFVAGWILLIGTSTFVSAVIFFTPEIRDPGLPILLFGLSLIVTVLVLLVVVLRALLRQATVLRADMDGVI